MRRSFISAMAGVCGICALTVTAACGKLDPTPSAAAPITTPVTNPDVCFYDEDNSWHVTDAEFDAFTAEYAKMELSPSRSSWYRNAPPCTDEQVRALGAQIRLHGLRQ